MYSDAYIFANLNHTEIAKIHHWNDKIVSAEKEWDLESDLWFKGACSDDAKEKKANEKWKKAYKEGGVVLAEIKQAVYERLLIANKEENRRLKNK